MPHCLLLHRLRSVQPMSGLLTLCLVSRAGNPGPHNALAQRAGGPPGGNPGPQGPQLSEAQQTLRDQLDEFRVLVLRAVKRLDLPVQHPLVQNFMYKCALPAICQSSCGRLVSWGPCAWSCLSLVSSSAGHAQ